MLCDTPQLVQFAVSRLRCSPRIIVDCEGQDLGCDTGLLSIISVGTEDGGAIFLFDVRLVSKAAIQPLVDLLADRLVPKLMWDGRRDSIEIRREFDIEIGRPWDLQLVDITSRKLRGIVGGHEFPARTSQPLSCMTHVDFADVHTLTSLKSVLTVHGVRQAAGQCRPEHSILVLELTFTLQHRQVTPSITRAGSSGHFLRTISVTRSTTSSSLRAFHNSS